MSIINKANIVQTPSILLMSGGLSLINQGKTEVGLILIAIGAILQELKYRRYSKTSE